MIACCLDRFAYWKIAAYNSATMPRTKAPVTEKNTKNDILDAYRELLAEVSQGSVDDGTQVVEKQLMDAASKETVEKITTDLSQLKLSFNQTIATLNERIAEEAERLALIQKAIAIARKDLAETQQIKVRAGMLQRMIEVQKEKEEAFEKEMKTTREVWELEQKEYDERVGREREREEDAYRYGQDLAKKRNADEQEEAKRAVEREKTAEKEARAQSAKELEELRKRVALGPAELEKAVKDAVGTALAQSKHEADIAAKLVKQEYDGEIRVRQLTIDQSETTVKNQSMEIARLKQQLDEAMKQVKDIAVAVIEGPKKDAGVPLPTKQM